ncbi:MAG: hypothetical protein U0172_02585 [Nitrospiraceae bacterium]
MFGLAFLVAGGLYVWLALFVAKQVGKSTDSRLAKYVTLVAFALLFTWDVIPGQLYFDYLCVTEAKATAIKRVEIGEEYFLKDGWPNVEKLTDRYSGTISQEEASALFHINKSMRVIQDKHTREVLGTATDFHYYGGWLSRFLFPDAGGFSCTALPHPGVLSTIWKEVFRVRNENARGAR